MSFPVVANNGSQEGEKKHGFVNNKVEPGFSIPLRQNFDPAMDPKQLKRLVSNRVAAQMARWKKHQYVEDLEKRSMELDKQVHMLRCQVEMASEQKRCLESEQRELKECISVRLQRCIIDEGEIEANRAEIERLKKKNGSLN